MDGAPPTESIVRRDCPAALRQAAVLAALMIVAAAILWLVRTDRLPLVADRTVYELEVPVPLVEPAAALAMYDLGDRLFIDTRSDRGSAPQVIPGSLRIRSAHFDDDLWEAGDFLFAEDPLLLYGSGDLSATVRVAERLLARDYQDVLILRGGLAAWSAAGGEIAPPPEFEEAGP